MLPCGHRCNNASALSAELFFVAEVLYSNIALRRALTDTSRDGKSLLLSLNYSFKDWRISTWYYY